MNPVDSARDILGAIYEKRRTESRISPAWLANEAMMQIDPQRAIPLEYGLANLQLRQIARAMLAKQFEPDDGNAEQHELWPELQARYPIKRNGDEEPVYVRLEDLPDDDAVYNIERLRSESQKKARHADRLEAWLIDRKNQRTASA